MKRRRKKGEDGEIEKALKVFVLFVGHCIIDTLSMRKYSMKR